VIPVYLLTGELGSGKTTLLIQWLQDPALAQAAVVINEIGEVGLDDRLISSAVEDAMTLTNQCVCCSGLPGLEETLEGIWWDRLYRKRPAFDAVVIETTGLADPAPIVASFANHAFLKKRYQLQGVLTTVSAVSDPSRADLRSQIQCADVLVLTKQDLNPAPLNSAPMSSQLSSQLSALNPLAATLKSIKGALPWAEVMQALAHRQGVVAPAPTKPPKPQHEEALGGHHHVHNAQVRFVPLPDNLTLEELRDQGQACLTPTLRRLKGVVCLDGQLTTVQWSPGDADMQLSAFRGDTSEGTTSKPTTQPPPKPPQLGWTCIEDL
jgi:G3E family GTPase